MSETVDNETLLVARLLLVEAAAVPLLAKRPPPESKSGRHEGVSRHPKGQGGLLLGVASHTRWGGSADGERVSAWSDGGVRLEIEQ